MSPLEDYRRKRRFDETPEPSGESTTSKRGKRRAKSLSFVVQKHDASRLHYDFRLELDGVLKSWAVPKGPALDPTEKRLAVEVEDHPLDYAGFEGIIPPGQYGGGTVIVWDRGTWTPTGDARAGLAAGKLKFELSGEKLRGGWALVRMRARGGDDKNWLLIKEHDDEVRPLSEYDLIDDRPESVLSGKTIDETAATSKRVWNSKPPLKKTAKTAKKKVAKRKTAAPKKVATRKKPAPATKDEPTELEDVTFTHPERVLYPERGITKIALARYYAAIADWILPHVVDRPLSLVRCPDGAGGQCFFQKHAGAAVPSALKRLDLREGEEPYLAATNLAGVLSLVQIGALEIHVWGSRSDALDRPDRLIFDLDPDPSVSWGRVIEAARELRDRLNDLSLVSFLKTTGGKGLHVVVPLARRRGWDDVKAFAKALCEIVRADAPDRYTVKASKAGRTGKIFLDYLRNDREATAIAPYSTRAKPGATVSAPIDWDELDEGVKSDSFHVGNVPDRLASLRRDPWEALQEMRQSLTATMMKRVGAA